MSAGGNVVDEYCGRFSAQDREGWLALWADDGTMEDPVGSPLKRGKDEIGAFFDQAWSMSSDISLIPEKTIIVGDQAAFSFRIESKVGDAVFVVDAIDVLTFDGAGLITSQRAFVDFTSARPK
jgi:steroid Delta-isomerase